MIGANMVAWVIFVLAALLEVGGDAVVRHGLRGEKPIMILGGGLMLALYGVVVNSVDWDFSRLLGVYVAVFAVVSILIARFVFDEHIATSTWIGLALIASGGLVIQFGPSGS